MSMKIPSGCIYPILLCVLIMGCQASDRTETQTERPEEILGWQLGAQAYTFKKYTFAETLNKLDSCGLRYVEAFTRQDIGGGIPGQMHYSMNTETRLQVQKMLKDKGITMVAYGVVKANGRDEWQQVFDFCKEMDVQTITCEPERKDLSIVSELCDTYKINAAIHNHPKPSSYWNADTVLAAIERQSPRMGACADIGHWVRSGQDPLKSLKKLAGHIKHLHFKDLNEVSTDAHDVIWGTGVCHTDAIIEELRHQGFKGMISVEYEYNWANNVPEVQASVEYFRNLLKNNNHE